MRINSVQTQAMSRDRKVVATSKRIFRKGSKPTVEGSYQVFKKMEKEIQEHMKYDQDIIVESFIVTISTSAGKYIKTFKQGCFK